MSLHKYPFVRILIPFALGIWVIHFFSPSLSVERFYGGWALLLLLFIGLIPLSLFVRSFSMRWVFGGVLSVFLFLAGVLVTERHQPAYEKTHFLNDTISYSFFLAKVIEPPTVKEKTIRLELSLVAVRDQNNKMLPRSGNILAYVSKTDQVVLPVYGQFIEFRKQPELIPPPVNPNQFDYRAYLNRKGIFHQVFLKESDWISGPMGGVNPLYKVAYYLRDYLLQALQSNHIVGDTYGVAAAILLGYDEKLPAYLRKGYTAAGAMHILCVSGLHVGIVFLFFDFLLGFMNRKNGLQSVKTILLLLMIWFYALLTGLSPSVQRAAIMLSFILFAKLFNKKGAVINSIAASAFLLLLLNPSVLFHLGFQLSYLAVLGIVLLQRPIYSLLYVKNKWIDKAWEITSVALAAQLATTPLVLHYFNQFPTYFMVSNLILVPFSFVVIVAGMVFLFVSFIPFLANIMGWITSGLVYTMNVLIVSIEQWPAAVLRNIYISSIESALIFILVGILYMAFVLRHRRMFVPALLVFVVFMSSIAFRSYDGNRQKSLVVYGLQNHTAIEVIDGKNHWLIADTALKADAFALGFNVEKNWVVRGLTPVPVWLGIDEAHRSEVLNKQGPVFRCLGKTIVVWNKQIKKEYTFPKEPFIADILVVSGNVYESLETLHQQLLPKLVVLDLSVPVYQAKRWEDSATKLNIQLHNIREKGAFELRL